MTESTILSERDQLALDGSLSHASLGGEDDLSMVRGEDKVWLALSLQQIFDPWKSPCEETIRNRTVDKSAMQT